MSEPEPPKDPDVIHALKNQLCIIVGFSELLLADFPPEDRRCADILEIHKAALDAMAVIPEVARRMQ